jgi:DNA-directed RNA polymerase specialized sigma24 family protein
MTAGRIASVARPSERVPTAVLVEGARRGEQAAWSALVDRFFPLVRSVARGCRLSDRDAEDVVQTVWLRLLEQRDRIHEPDALPGWIITTARRESVRLARRPGREAPWTGSTSASHWGPTAPRWTTSCCAPSGTAPCATAWPRCRRRSRSY